MQNRRNPRKKELSHPREILSGEGHSEIGHPDFLQVQVHPRDLGLRRSFK